MTTDVSLIRLQATITRVGLSRSTIYALVQRGEFPKPVRLSGTRCVAWRSDEVEAWINKQAERA